MWVPYCAPRTPASPMAEALALRGDGRRGEATTTRLLFLLIAYLSLTALGLAPAAAEGVVEVGYGLALLELVVHAIELGLQQGLLRGEHLGVVGEAGAQ